MATEFSPLLYDRRPLTSHRRFPHGQRGLARETYVHPFIVKIPRHAGSRHSAQVS